MQSGQYATADTLRTKISIREKYSVNRPDFKGLDI